MFSICYNSRVKLWRNGKTCWKITKIKLFINKYNWDGTNYPSEKNDWKKVKKTNVTNALNVLYVKEEKIYYAYVSKNNLNREKQVILSMISNGEKGQSHYLALKKLSVLLRGIISKHYCYFYCF